MYSAKSEYLIIIIVTIGHKVSSWLQDDDHTSLVLSQIEASQSLRDLVKEAKQVRKTRSKKAPCQHACIYMYMLYIVDVCNSSVLD